MSNSETSSGTSKTHDLQVQSHFALARFGPIDAEKPGTFATTKMVGGGSRGSVLIRPKPAKPPPRLMFG
jgi:hypothetical protein